MMFPEDSNRDVLVRIVQKIMNADGSETELDEMLNFVERYSPHPNVSDLIFYPVDDDCLTAEQIVDKIYQYRPIITPPSSPT